MPLRRSAARRASRKDEVSSLLGWNGEALLGVLPTEVVDKDGHG